MKIRTNYKTNAAGKGQIVAKGGGKQRTFPYDHAVSPATNHGNAAGVLASVHGLDYKGVVITLGVDNGKAEFEVKS